MHAWPRCIPTRHHGEAYAPVAVTGCHDGISDPAGIGAMAKTLPERLAELSIVLQTALSGAMRRSHSTTQVCQEWLMSTWLKQSSGSVANETGRLGGS